MGATREEKRSADYQKLLDGWKNQVGQDMYDVFRGEENKYTGNNLRGFSLSTGRIAAIDWEPYSLIYNGKDSLLRICVLQDRIVSGLIYIPVKCIFLAHDGNFEVKEKTSSGNVFGYRGAWTEDTVRLCEFDKQGESKGVILTRDEMAYLYEKLSIMKDYEPAVKDG